MKRVSASRDSVLEIVNQATFNPDWFCDTILRCPNDPWQSEILEAIADLDRIAFGYDPLYNDGLTRISIRSPHGPGKTHVLAKLMHWFNFTRKGRIPCTAPKERQLVTRLWPEFRKILGKSVSWYKQLIHVDKTQITWFKNEDWCALIEAANQAENLAGYHDNNLLFIVDEASGVDEIMFPAIEGALSDGTAILAMIGNPTQNEGEFYNSHKKPGTKEIYYKKHVHPDESPRISQQWIANMERKYGKDSPIVKIRCYGEFAEASENQLLHIAWLERAKERESIDDGSHPRLRVSVDVADGGEDETVVTVAKHYDSYVLMLKQYRYSFPPSEAPIDAANAAETRFLEWGGKKGQDDLVIDSIGVGAGTAGALIKRGHAVITYKGGESSSDPSLYRNRRVQSYLSLRDAHRDNEIVYEENFLSPEDWDDYVGQMVSIKTKPGIERVEDLETKSELSKRGIKSPDMADSAAMQFATQAPELLMSHFTPEVITRLVSAGDV